MTTLGIRKRSRGAAVISRRVDHDGGAIRPSEHGDAGSAEAKALVAGLGQTIEGEVRFSDGDRALYSTDSSSYRQLTIGLVIPKTVDDVVITVAACQRQGLPIVARGGGTSVAGQCCNAAVVMDFSKYLNAIRGAITQEDSSHEVC